MQLNSISKFYPLFYFMLGLVTKDSLDIIADLISELSTDHLELAKLFDYAMLFVLHHRSIVTRKY